MQPPHQPTQIILDLLAEKDGLIREKDELVESKNKLWREYYDLLQEKDREIAELRQEAVHKASEMAQVKDRSRQLETALRDLLDRQEDSEDEDVEVQPGKDEAVEEQEVIGDETIRKLSPDADVPPNNLGPERPVFDAKPPVSRQPTVNDADPPSAKRDHNSFTFAPLVRVSANGQDEFGEIGSIAAPVIRSIRSTMDELAAQNHHGSSFESTCCGWRYLEGHRSQAPWALDLPRRFACRSCFNARRACLLWLGNMQWLILPLPPQVRSRNTMWRHAEYYIYPGEEDSTDFPGVWRESSRQRKRKAADISG